jgi:hypothetical protein
MICSDSIYQRLCREALVWRQLQHPNVVPFLGMNWSLFPHDALPSLLAPWMEYGTLREYMEGPLYDPVRCFLQLVWSPMLDGSASLIKFIYPLAARNFLWTCILAFTEYYPWGH